MIALAGLASLGIVTAAMAWSGLKCVEKALKAKDDAYARHFMMVSTIWSAATAVIAAISIGGFR